MSGANDSKVEFWNSFLPDFGAPENKKIPFPFPIFWKSLLPCGIQVWPTVAVAATAQKGISLTEVGRKDLIIPSLSRPLPKCGWVGSFFIFIFQASTLKELQQGREDNSLQKLQMEKKTRAGNFSWRRRRS